MPNNTSNHTPGQEVLPLQQVLEIAQYLGAQYSPDKFATMKLSNGESVHPLLRLKHFLPVNTDIQEVVSQFSAPTLAAELERVKAQLAALTISLDTSIDTNGLLREELRREHSSVMALGPELASSMNEISRLKSLNSELVEALTALHRTIISLSEQSDTNALDRLEIIRRDNEPTIQKARAALAKSEKGI